MKLTLTWKNLNVGPVSMTIYRGDAPLDPAALPAPLVTLTAGEETWIDPSVVRGNLYYYMFVTTGTSDKVATRNYPIRALPRRGHGPTDLLYGDYELGYYGSLTALEFATSLDVLKAIGYGASAASTMIFSNSTLPNWHKFARKGKTLYIPDGAICKVSWQALALKGAIYGMDTGYPDFNTPKHNTPQTAKIKIGPDQYRIRTIRGSDGDQMTPTALVAGFVTSPTEYSEWDDLAATMINYINVNQRLPNVAAITPALFNFTSSSRGLMCQEVNASNSVMERGSTWNSALAISQRMVDKGITSTSPWLPVLELIEG